MSNLTVFDNDGLELVINTQTGESFATQTGYARMSGLSQQAINKRCNRSDNQDGFLEAEIPTSKGLRTYNLIPAKLVFKWLMKDNPDLAERMGEAGATIFLQRLAGWEKPKTNPQLSIKDSINLVGDILTEAGIDPKLVAGVKLNQAESCKLITKEMADEAHSLLAASLESEVLLTPTKIGQELGISAIKVNRILLDIGYQIKNLNKTSKTEPSYFVTDLGKPYSGNTLATGDRGDNTTYQHLKWATQVVGIVREHLED